MTLGILHKFHRIFGLLAISLLFSGCTSIGVKNAVDIAVEESVPEEEPVMAMDEPVWGEAPAMAMAETIWEEASEMAMAETVWVESPAPAPAMAMAAPLPKVHAWKYLRGYGAEPENYATYSYVLVGRTDSGSEAVQNFYKLIQSIQGNTNSTSEILNGTPRRNTNIFLVPAVSDENLPDTILAKAYVSALESSHDNFRRPGPFIVTLYEPLSAESSELKELLFVDLTGINEGAFKEILSVFKGRVMDSEISKIEHLRSLRISLLNILLMAEESIHFASTAHAQMRAVFKPE